MNDISNFLTSTFSGWAISASFSINAWRASLTRYSCLVYWLLASLMLNRIASQFLRKRARRFLKRDTSSQSVDSWQLQTSKCAINTLGISSQYKKMITIENLTPAYIHVNKVKHAQKQEDTSIASERLADCEDNHAFSLWYQRSKTITISRFVVAGYIHRLQLYN